MHKPPDYQAIEYAIARKGASQVVERLDAADKDLLKRIEWFVDRFGFQPQTVRDEIRRNKMFSAHFAKDPRRTGFHEKVAACWLKQFGNTISEFKTLPKSGKNAWYITSDGHMQKNVRPKPSKSLDFKWKTGRFTVYATHKYTREGGGNQDSQYDEVKLTLRHFQNGAVDDDTMFLAIVDGPYYTEEKLTELNRFERIKAPYCKAMHIEYVPNYLEHHLCLEK
ncbi:MAG: hypothetical protein OXG24_04505 [Gammaproteobacteria bacterium]|nr:hypothetical protein [Gammaproteobacteria bacterium]